MIPVNEVRKLMRPFITVSFVLCAVALVSFGKVDAEKFMTIVGMIVAFYFGERSALKDPNIPNIPEE